MVGALHSKVHAPCSQVLATSVPGTPSNVAVTVVPCAHVSLHAEPAAVFSKIENETLLAVAAVSGKLPQETKSPLQQLSAGDTCPAAVAAAKTSRVTAAVLRAGEQHEAQGSTGGRKGGARKGKGGRYEYEGSGGVVLYRALAQPRAAAARARCPGAPRLPAE